MELGIVWPPTWLELARVGSSWLEFDQAQNFAQVKPSFPPFGHLSQISPSCFVIARWLRGRSQTIGWFSCELPRLGSDASFDFVTWVELGSTVWPGRNVANAVVGASTPSESLRLCGKDGPVTVHSAVMCSELIGMAATDLPFVLRVESRPRCWPTRNLYLLAPNFREKQRWVTALEAVLGDIRQRSMGDSDQVVVQKGRGGERWKEEGERGEGRGLIAAAEHGRQWSGTGTEGEGRGGKKKGVGGGGRRREEEGGGRSMGDNDRVRKGRGGWRIEE